MTFTQETRPEFRLVENPADRFPRSVQQKLDAAQQTIWENNKPSGSLGDKSTQFAAIAEVVAGRSLTQTGGRGVLHRGKNEDYGRGLARYIQDSDFPEGAKSIFISEKRKSDEAKVWCDEYVNNEIPTLPAWAAAHKNELVRLGLLADYPAEEPERRGRRRR